SADEETEMPRAQTSNPSITLLLGMTMDFHAVLRPNASTTRYPFTRAAKATWVNKQSGLADATQRADALRDVQDLAETFPGPRPGYRRANAQIPKILEQF